MPQHTQAQAPPLGSLVNPSGAGAMTPPKTPEEKESLKSEILSFLGRPEVQAGLLQFAVGALQPLGPGDSPIGALARAGAGGLQAAGRVRLQAIEAEREAFGRDRELNAEELEKLKVEEARIRQEIASGAMVESAGIRAGATTGAAETRAGAATEVARIGAGARIGAAEIGVGGAVALEEAKSARPRVVTSADSGEIRRQLVTKLGGFFDPATQEVRGLSPSAATQLVNLSAEASRIFGSDKSLTHAEAVRGALQNMGLAGTPGAPTTPSPVSLTKEDRSTISAQNVSIRSALTQIPGLVEAVLGPGSFPSAGTGVLSMTAAGIDNLLGQVGTAFGGATPVFFQDTQDGRQKLRQFIVTVRNVLTENNKFIVGEQEGIESLMETFDPDTFFSNPATGARNVQQVLDFLRTQLGSNEAMLGIVAPTTFNSPAEVDRVTLEALRAFLLGNTSEVLDRLSPEVKASIKARFNEDAARAAPNP